MAQAKAIKPGAWGKRFLYWLAYGGICYSAFFSMATSKSITAHVSSIVAATIAMAFQNLICRKEFDAWPQHTNGVFDNLLCDLKKRARI